MEKEINIVKKVCAELRINQRELSKIMRVNEVTVRQWSSKGQIPETAIAFMECIVENQKLKKANITEVERLKKEKEEIIQALSILKKYLIKI